MLVSNTESIPGYQVAETLGLVEGSSVRAKHVGRDLTASLKNLMGGELKAYTELMNETRAEAVKRMVDMAEELGAEAVINIRFTTTSIAAGAAEICAYGTAVKLVNV